MKKQFIKVGLIIFFILGLISCKTYYIPVDSFIAQFKAVENTKLRTVYTQDPYWKVFHYETTPIDYIKCVDKNNKPIVLRNSPSLEIRFTQKNNKRTVFYFDRVFLQDTLIIGDRSRFFGLRKTISINNVKLIEIQDGHKKYRYVNKSK